MAISKYQKFTTETIHRSQIKNAEYNPRKIGENEAKELRKGLKKFGLVETLIWNRHTGNLVGGHQRITQIDSLENDPDYELTVSVIDVDIKQEKEINLLLNNPNLQGEYDTDALAKMIGDIDFKSAGFTQYDMDIMGIDLDLKEFENRVEPNNTKENIEKIKASKKESREKSTTQKENYIVVTFSSPEAKESFLDKIGQETDDRYVKGETLAKLLI